MRDVLVCLDAASGREQWRVDFPKQRKSPLPSFGFVCSPLVDGNAVYVQAGGGVAKVRADSGEIEWLELQDGGGMFGSAFSSPVIAEIADKRQLVVQTRSKLAGLDLKTGKALWSQEVPAFRGMNILTPTVWGDRVFTSSYGGGSFCFQVTAQDGRFSVRKVWKNKVQGYMSSPLLIGGNLYLHLRNQRFTSLAADDGTQRWTTTPFGKYWSMAARGNRILALDERGELLLIAASDREFTLLDRRKITEHPAWAHIAVAGEEVFVRDLAGLTAYRWKVEE
jgi:outer membrane protein assembly factor BamB